MNRIVDASCENKILKIEGQIVDGMILTQGVGESEGVAFIDGEKVVYITSNSDDIKETLTKLNTAILKIGEILTAIGAGMTGPTTAPPPTLASGVIELTNMASELTLLSGKLK